MDPGKPNAEPDEPRALLSYESEGLSWSIQRLIELIDEAIDTAGAHLARSAALWADSPSLFDERERSTTRRRSYSLSASSPYEEPDREQGIDPM
jgi:hypothetical protein